MKIFLVRHGESKGNKDPSEYFKHHDSDIEITEKGKKDSIDAADRIYTIIDNSKKSILNYEFISNPNIYFNLVHSTYKRATQTANIIYDRLNDNKGYSVQNIIPSPLCIEREWGSLRDIVSSKLKTEEHFNFYYRPINGESFCDVYKRVVTFHQWLINTSKYENNIVVAHGEFNRVYLMHLLNWNIGEFEKWKNQKNGEVWFINNGELSSLTPLTSSHYKK